MLDYLERHDATYESFIIRHPLKKETQVDVGLLLEGLENVTLSTDFKDLYKTFDEMVQFFTLEMRFEDHSTIDFEKYQMKLWYLYNLRDLFKKVAATQKPVEKKSLSPNF